MTYLYLNVDCPVFATTSSPSAPKPAKNKGIHNPID